MTARSRNFFGNRFVYAVISQRAHGLSIGVNMNPDKFCNFDCVYCEVDRRELPRDPQVNCEIMSAELRHLYLGHLSRECNKPEIARRVMDARLQKIGATHVRVEVAAQDVPCTTLKLTAASQQTSMPYQPPGQCSLML